MSNRLRQRLCESIDRVPGWGNPGTRRAQFCDLAWGLTDQEDAGSGGSREQLADSLADLALAAGDRAPVDRRGGAVLGLRGLIEDLRELGAWADPESSAAEVDHRTRGYWCEDPYPGLLPLEHWQAPIHFGHRAETRALLRRLVDPAAAHLQVITGVRGCGKSSLLQAGVRGWLAAGGLPRIPHAGRWLVSTLFPAGYGGDPFLALTHGLGRALRGLDFDAPGEAALLKVGGAEALAGLLARVLEPRPAETFWVLLIDRLEELFAVVESDLADEFLEMLIGSLGQPRLRVLTAIRADRLHHCFARPDLIPILNAGGLFVLGPPSRAGLGRMILGPLSILEPRLAVTLERHLVGHLLDDVQGHPEGLALLADALKELYARGRAGVPLTLEVYRDLRLQGLRGGLARRAELALERAGEGARTAIGGLFSQLVRVDADGTASRRRADRTRLAAHPATHRLVQSLAEPDTRLVRVRQGERPTVELAHGALLQEWPTLRHWIGRRREALRTRGEIEVEAHAWACHGRPAHLRWRDEVLEPARELLGEQGLLQELEKDQDIADFLTPEAEWLTAELACSWTTPARREEIGLRLAQVGDSRAGVGLSEGSPAIAWCALPPGEVRVEGHGVFQVPALRIAAFPVTQVQFESFLDAADGFHRPDWWEDLRRPAPPSGRLPRQGNYPATRVSWFDAMAFCRWLSARLGSLVRLPDEWEWQWAAQSVRPGFVYPWGRDWREGHGNTEESGLGRVAAVGLHPAGRSHQGVYDLAGNNWEWCRNRYDQPRIVAPDAASSRVLRGGSWRVNRGFARADFRLEGLPEDRMAGSGFRLVTTA